MPAASRGPRAVLRAARVVGHLFAGLGTVLFVFPWVTIAARRRRVQLWSARLLRLLGVERHTTGNLAALREGNRLLVANHVSWVDVFVLDAVHATCFVAKSEIRRWPLIGTLVAGVGTLFIERGRRTDTRRIKEMMREALDRGDLVGVFPEGTTTDGSKVLPFHVSLLQAVVDSRGAVVPVAIRYRSDSGGRSDAVAYTGDTTFVQSFWQIIGERRIRAEVVVLDALPAAGSNRRDLARAAEELIRTALAPAPAETPPGRPDDPRAARQ